MFAKLDLKGFCGATYLKGGIKTQDNGTHFKVQGLNEAPLLEILQQSYLCQICIYLFIFNVFSVVLCWNSHVGDRTDTPG